MFPDYPTLKSQIRRILMKRFTETMTSQAPMMRRMKKTFVKEGGSLVFRYPDDHEESMVFKEIESTMVLSKDDFLAMEAEKLLATMDSAAQSMGREQAQMILAKVEEAATSVGNVVKYSGREFTVDRYFDMIRRVQIDFDEHGVPSLPELVSNKEGVAQAMKVIQQIHSDPALVRKLEDLFEEKKAEWRDREAYRQLVG